MKDYDNFFLPTNDIEQGRDFYQKILGLSVKFDFSERGMIAFKVGDHSSTFGGNPLACASASAAIDVVLEENLPERAVTLGKYFKDKLDVLRGKYKIVREVRGLGLMIGMEFRFDVFNIILGSMKRGVIILDAGRNILRFLPPLVISREQIDQVVSVLDVVIGEEESARLRGQPAN